MQPNTEMYAGLLPPLSKDEFYALKTSIERIGVLDSVILDEDGNVLDGHHRLKIEPNAPTKVISGMSESEKRAFVYSRNLHRRNMTPEQKAELVQSMGYAALSLKNEGKTLVEIGAIFGVSESTTSRWINQLNEYREVNGKRIYKKEPVDCRVKIKKERHTEIVSRLNKKEPLADVAADFGVQKSTVLRIYENSNKPPKLPKKDKPKIPVPKMIQWGIEAQGEAFSVLNNGIPAKKKLLAILTEFKKEAKAFAKEVYGERINTTEVDAKVSDVKRVIDQHAAYAPCPYCGRKINPRCKACKAKGWVDRFTFEGAPKEQQVAILGKNKDAEE